MEFFTEDAAQNLARGMLLAPHAGHEDNAQTLLTWEWRTLHVEGRFITSDKPVLLNQGRDHPSSEVWMITMALSPSSLLLWVPASSSHQIDDEWSRGSVAGFNCMLVSRSPRFVYSACPLRVLPGLRLEKMLEHFLADADVLAVMR